MSRRRFEKMTSLRADSRDLAWFSIVYKHFSILYGQSLQNFRGRWTEETAKEEENKKYKDPEAQKTDEFEQKILAKNPEEVKTI